MYFEILIYISFTMFCKKELGGTGSSRKKSLINSLKIYNVLARSTPILINISVVFPEFN